MCLKLSPGVTPGLLRENCKKVWGRGSELNNKSKKRVLITSGVLSFIASVVFLFRCLFIILNYTTYDYSGAVLEAEHRLLFIHFSFALGLVILATYLVHKSSKVDSDKQ